RGGMPARHFEEILAGRPVYVSGDPCPYSPIAQDDINAQVESLLGAASVPATIVNWAGDETVGPHDWCPFFAELAGVEAQLVVPEVPETTPGGVNDVTLRRSITGPCRVSWQDGMRDMFEAWHPELVRG